MSTFNRIESAWCIYRNARKWGYFLTQREQLPFAVQHGFGPMPTNLFWLSLSLSLSLSLALLSTFLSTKPCQTLIITSPSLSAAISTNREQERETHTSRDVPWALGLFAGMRQCFQTSKAYSCEPAALCKSSDTLMPPDSRQEGGETDCV